jgi:hypothetical protein
VRANVTKDLLDWRKLLSGDNAEIVKLLRLCVDCGEERIFSIKDQLPQNIIPSVDMIRSQLRETTESNDVYFKNEVPITTTDLSKYDEKCGVVCASINCSVVNGLSDQKTYLYLAGIMISNSKNIH